MKKIIVFYGFFIILEKERHSSRFYVLYNFQKLK